MHAEILADNLVIVPDEQHGGLSLSTFLQRHLRLPKGFINKAFATERIHVGKRPAEPDLVLHASQPIWLSGGIWPEQEPLFQWEVEQAHVLLEDDHLMVVDKPADLLVHSDGANQAVTLDEQVLAYRVRSGQPALAWHIHRLDVGTSGVLLYAKHAWMARSLDTMLAAHEISRHYLAVVAGEPKAVSGVLTGPIGRDRHVTGRYRVSSTGKPARTHYHVLDTAEIGSRHVSLVKCWLETGRTHQIRVHLSDLGCPIIGDTLYGGGEGAGDVRLPVGYALHAWRLSFIHPYLGYQIEVTAPLPTSWAPLQRVFGEALNAPPEVT